MRSTAAIAPGRPLSRHSTSGVNTLIAALQRSFDRRLQKTLIEPSVSRLKKVAGIPMVDRELSRRREAICEGSQGSLRTAPRPF